MGNFRSFIDSKPLYYEDIDHKRVHIAYKILEPYIKKPKIIHIIGTNGKGSTGRIMATLLHHQGVEVGHFSSPHILEFNERIWLRGEDIDDDSLEKAHDRLYAILPKDMRESLSYFEYTTLLALVAMEDLEIIIFEAGFGGEFDATNIVSKILSVITPIGLDHQDFLGETIADIATTKIKSIQKEAIIGFQPNREVYNIAKDIAKLKGAELHILEDLNLDEVEERIERITEELDWGIYLYENALLATYALKILGYSYNIEDIKKVRVFGRFYPIRPNITVDVGHNLLAVEAISKTLERRCKKDIILLYNSLNDKDYISILKRLKKYIKRVEIIPIETERALDIKRLKRGLEILSIDSRVFNGIDEREEYLVFGSFYVVEAFLRWELG